MDAEWANFALTVGTLLLGGVIWNIRLEGKLKNQRDICALQYDHLQAQIVSLQNKLEVLEEKNEGVVVKIYDLLNTMNTRLAHIEGSIAAKPQG